MKAIYIPLGAPGHILASLPMVGSLVKKGVEVTYFAPEAFRSQVELTGALFSPIPAVAAQGGSVDAGTDFIAGIPLVFLSEAEGVIDTILPVVEKNMPDVVIADEIGLAGRLVAAKYHLPLVMMFTSYAPNRAFSISRFWPVYPDDNPARAAANKIADRLTAEYGVKHLDIYEIFEGIGDFNIVTQPKSFHPGAETCGDNFFFAGAQVAPRADSGTWQAPTNGKPLLYTSLGSLFNNWPEFYQMLFPIVKDMDINVLCSLGKVLKPKDLGEIPANVTTMAFTPQLEVLEHCDYFITHAGTGSAMEALYYGVPCLCIPQMDEQMLTADRMVELKLASAALRKPQVTEETLKKALTELIDNPVYTKNAKRVSKEMNEEGGCDRAAQVVIDFMRSRK
jgi:MGT family glycosyltransferase